MTEAVPGILQTLSPGALHSAVLLPCLQGNFTFATDDGHAFIAQQHLSFAMVGLVATRSRSTPALGWANVNHDIFIRG